MAGVFVGWVEDALKIVSTDEHDAWSGGSKCSIGAANAASTNLTSMFRPDSVLAETHQLSLA